MWVQQNSRSHPGFFYYYNTETGASQWEKPVTSTPSLPSLSSALPSSLSSSGGPSRIRASHILVKHRDVRNPQSWNKAPVTRTKEEAMEKLQRIRGKITDGATNFPELAAEFSDCSSSRKGGDLDFFERRQMQKPFEDAAFALQVGQLSDIVETNSGYHIILRTQ